MAKIAFFVLPHSSSILASLKLAHDLRDAGHGVRYFGIEDSRTCVSENGFEFVPPYETHFPAGYFAANMAKYGYRHRLYDYRYKRFSSLKAPELYSFPLALEFPGADTLPDRYYIGPSIDLQRAQAAFPWQRIDDRPRIYCAMGNLVFLGKRKYLEFFDTALAVAARKTDWQWVVAVGGAVDPGELRATPANAVVVRHAPQLDLPRRAALAICHGGANSIKESAYFGVPMAMFPLGIDHRGNASRATYHGLGLTGEIGRLTVAYLLELVETVMGNPYFRPRSGIMRAKLQRAEEANLGVGVVEQILRA